MSTFAKAFCNANEIDVSRYSDKLFHQLSNITIHNIESIKRIRNKLQLKEQQLTPLGLVHGDFKPWNILPTSPIVFFDFEEVVFDGLPLEDLLNYIIDPDIRYQSSKEIASVVFQEKNVSAYINYLGLLNINIDFKFFLYFYLLARVAFWASRNQADTAKCYLDLLLFIDQSENAINVS